MPHLVCRKCGSKDVADDSYTDEPLYACEECGSTDIYEVDG